jgi:hypothetical protein
MPAQAAETPATVAAQQTFASEARRLFTAYADGGVELEDALAALIDAQPDPAAAVSELIGLLGARPTPGQIAAAGNAIRRAANYTVDALMKAIAALIVAADDPMMMTMNTLAISPYLDAERQAAIGVGLARAAAGLRDSGRGSIAEVIDVEIATAEAGPLRQAYVTERGEAITTKGIRQNQKNPLNLPPDYEPQSASPN